MSYNSLILNGSFEEGAPPTYWTKVGAGGAFTQSNEQAKVGTYSAKLVRTSGSPYIYQDVTNYTAYRGLSVTLGVWVYASIASFALIDIADGVGETYDYAAGTGAWEWVTITRTVSASATQLRVICQTTGTNGTAYFDGVIFVTGSDATASTLPAHKVSVAFTSDPLDDPLVYDMLSGVQEIHCKRGRRQELDRMEAGTLTVLLENSDGYFYPDNNELLTNGSFESGDPPTSWTLSGANATFAQSAVQYKVGSYSGLLTRVGTNCFIYQSVSTYANYKGKPVTFGCWVYATVATRAIIEIYDGVSYSDSSYHSGVAGWEWLTVTRTINANATQLTARCYVINGNTAAYFDGATLFSGTGINPYSPNVLPMKAIRVQSIYNSTLYDIIECFIDSWELQWVGGGGTAPQAIIKASGALKIIAQQVLNTTYTSKASGLRVGDVLSSCTWPAGKRTVDTGAETLLNTGALANVNALSHLQSVQDSELSLLYEAANGNIAYEGRGHRAAAPHTSVQAIFGDDPAELPFTDIKFSLDDTLIYNDVRLTGTGGVEQTLTNAASQTAYGIRSLVRSSLFNTTDAAVYQLAVFLIARFAAVVSRVESIEITPGSDPTNLWPKVLGYDISTRIAINLDQASVTRECFIESITHDWDAKTLNFKTTWELSDADQYFATPDTINETIRPNLAGDKTQATPSVGANYTCVDEVVTDDADYVYAPNDGGYLRDLYNMPSSAYGAGTINSVKVYGRFKKEGASAGYCQIALKTGGTEYETGVFTVTTSYVDYSNTWALNPKTGIAWVWADIVALQIGCEVYGHPSAFNTRSYCSQVWVVVNFTPSWA